jgi:hypothetical protein
MRGKWTGRYVAGSIGTVISLAIPFFVLHSQAKMAAISVLKLINYKFIDSEARNVENTGSCSVLH